MNFIASLHVTSVRVDLQITDIVSKVNISSIIRYALNFFLILNWSKFILFIYYIIKQRIYI